VLPALLSAGVAEKSKLSRKICLTKPLKISGKRQLAEKWTRTIPLSVEGRGAAEKSSETDKPQKPEGWRIQRMVLAGPHGEIEISGGSMPALLSLMANLGQEGE